MTILPTYKNAATGVEMSNLRFPVSLIKQIGGELEASLALSPSMCDGPFQDALTGGLWFDSGRGALAALLQWLTINSPIDRVYLPGFICQSVADAVEYSSLPYEVYSVDNNMQAEIEPKPRSAVIGVHYFGFVNESLRKLSEDAAEDIIIIEDCAQALLTDLPSLRRRPIHYRLYSPRKFLGIPAGGCLWGHPLPDISLSSGDTVELWKAWVGRFLKSQYRHSLVGTRQQELEQSYLGLMEEFERFLDEHPGPRALPEVVLQIIRYQDYQAIFARRCENYNTLVKLLPPAVEPLFPCLPEATCPLGCPVVIRGDGKRDEVRQLLKQEHIFCAVHWPRPKQFVSQELALNDILYDSLLTLPIDQRYGGEDMKRITETIVTLVS